MNGVVVLILLCLIVMFYFGYDDNDEICGVYILFIDVTDDTFD